MLYTFNCMFTCNFLLTIYMTILRRGTVCPIIDLDFTDEDFGLRI